MIVHFIVIEIDGNTEFKFDFPQQSWNNIWNIEAGKWLSLANSGIVAPIF